MTAGRTAASGLRNNVGNVKQRTLAKEVKYSGVGLHSGKEVILCLKPAPENTGVIFVRTDLSGCPEIHARAENISATVKATTISENGAEISTIEHLMSAFSMAGVDNVRVKMSSSEPPVADGSAKVFFDLIEEAGLSEQDAKREPYVVDKTFAIHEGDRSIMIEPYNGFKITFTSVNKHPLLGTQYFDIELTEGSFGKEIAPARTVAFLEEIELLKKMGMGLGGTLENTVVFAKDKVLSDLRFQDELIRHKILDVIGDMYLLGPIKGHIIASQTGHALNSRLTKKIAAYRLKGEQHMAVLDINEIKKILPHRFPMLLVDKILELEPMRRAVGIKNITVNEIQFLGHFPNEPIFPGVLLIEAMAQVGGVAMLYPKENRGKLAVFGKIDNVRFRKKVVPGDQVVTTAEVVKIKGNMGVIHCEGKVDGNIVSECDCFFAIIDPREA